MKITELCKEYCIGCGLCKSELNSDFSEDEKGFLSPVFQQCEAEKDFLERVCPVTDKHTREDGFPVWGDGKEVFAAYSTDCEIRNRASSGGVLTALAIYLLETGKVDAVLQVKSREEKPTETVLVISTSKEQIIDSCGSRYAISSPWLNLSEQIEEKKTYAAIAKPCDILALRRLQNEFGKYKNITYLFSFFCAGLPSKTANRNLMEKLGCNEERCKSLVYRGNGWPGYATAVDTDGVVYKMNYSRAWGEILGRDVNPFCRLCMDGIGEAADIACGDGWYVKDGEPDFSEREGRNVVFLRNQRGEEIFKAAVKGGYLHAETWEDLRQLQVIQKYQYTRRTTMRAKLLAYRIGLRKAPQYDRMTLKEYAKSANGKQKAKIFLGTMKRIISRKI